MSDIRTIWQTDLGIGDFAPVGAGASHDIETAVLLSLFSDRVATADDPIPDAGQGGLIDRRGWWGDAYLRRPLGSRLWLLAREKQIKEVLNKARDYCTEALAWMIEDQICARIDVVCAFTARGRIDIQVILFRRDGRATNLRYDYAWKDE